MRLRSWSIAGLGVLALGAGLAASVGAQGQGQGQGDQTIVVYEKADRGSFSYVDARPFTRLRRGLPRRVSPGDAFIARNPLFSDAAGTQRAGRLIGSCEATNGSRRFDRVTWMCEGVARLSGGDITFSGIAPAASDTGVFAVTGGTGNYEGARGQVTIVNQPNGGSTDTIHLIGGR